MFSEFSGLSSRKELSETEFGRLFHQCRKPFVIVANSYVHDLEVAEDLVNDSFVKLWEKRSEILTDNFEAYLFQIVIRRCLDHLKSEHTQSRIRQNLHQAKYRMLAYEINSLSGCDPNRLYAHEIERLYQECIAQMPTLSREVFLANRIQNKTYKEIAEEQGISVRQVTTEIQNALACLRRALKDYLPILLLLDPFNRLDL